MTTGRDHIALVNGIEIHRNLLPCAKTRRTVIVKAGTTLSQAEHTLWLENTDSNFKQLCRQEGGCHKIPQDSC